MLFRRHRKEPVALDEVVDCLPATHPKKLHRLAYIQERSELPLPQDTRNGDKSRPSAKSRAIVELGFVT